MGSSVTTRRKSWEKITVLGTLGVISEIQRAKFGVFVIYIFGGKIWGSDTNFIGKFWDQAPRPPSMEVPPWACSSTILLVFVHSLLVSSPIFKTGSAPKCPFLPFVQPYLCRKVHNLIMTLQPLCHSLATLRRYYDGHRYW